MRLKVKKFQAILYLSLFAATSCDTYQPSNQFKNHDFEEPLKNGSPSNWYTGQHAGETAYKYTIDNKIFKKGKQSFKMEQFKSQVYGIIDQSVILPKKRNNKKFVFSAMLKTKDVTSKLGWRLVVNCRRKDSYIIKQIQSKPIFGTTDWTKVTLEADIPKDTYKLDAGIMLQSIGIGWVDDASLIIDPKSK